MKAAIVDVLLYTSVGWFHLVARLLYGPLWILTMIGRMVLPSPALVALTTSETLAVPYNR